MCRNTQNSFGLNIVGLTFRKAGVVNITMALAVIKVSLLVAISLALVTYPCPSSGETNFQPVDSHLPIQEGLPRLPDTDSVLQDPGVSTSVPVTAKFQDPNLHPEHYPYYFTQHPEEAEICRRDASCLHKVGCCHYFDNFYASISCTVFIPVSAQGA